MEDILGLLLRLLGSVFRFVLEALLEWFWISGISKLPRRRSQVATWWRTEGVVSKLHSVAALLSAFAVAVLVVMLFAVLLGFAPFQ